MSASKDFIVTPFGIRHKALVNVVASGVRLLRRDKVWQKIAQTGHLLADVQRALDVKAFAAPGTDTEWLSHADWQNDSGVPIDSFRTEWRVPPPPVNSGDQTIFLFNSLMPSDSSHILQPVLQWGASQSPSAAKRWAVASWWVGGKNEPLFITDLVPVESGAALVGLMTRNNSAATGFEYTSEFVGIPGTKLVISNVSELTICSEVLEVANIGGANDYPHAPRTSMSQIEIGAASALPVAWTPSGRSLPNVVVNSGTQGQVDLIYPT